MMDKVCMITGASRGIGLAAALRMARAGYGIAAVARNEAHLSEAAGQIRQAGGQCVTIAADVGQPNEAKRIVDETHKQCGRIDVLVNNAGIAPLKPLSETTAEDFAQVLAINMAAVFHTTRTVFPLMQQQGGGVIINVSSQAAADPFPGFSIYGASKAWVNIFTKATAAEGKPHGIRIYSVAPGAVETGMMRAAFPDFPADKALAPDDVASVIESVCDDRMASCTGETIYVRR